MSDGAISKWARKCEVWKIDPNRIPQKFLTRTVVQYLELKSQNASNPHQPSWLQLAAVSSRVQLVSKATAKADAAAEAAPAPAATWLQRAWVAIARFSRITRGA